MKVALEPLGKVMPLFSKISFAVFFASLPKKSGGTR
jgi:hypothetical protein